MIIEESFLFHLYPFFFSLLLDFSSETVAFYEKAGQKKWQKDR